LRLARDHRITVLMVSHDIDEAVHVSDRVLVMEADPGSVSRELRIDLPRPRDRDHANAPAFAGQVREALQAVHAF
jgi:sulfonate transport system ATP-binding protein